MTKAAAWRATVAVACVALYALLWVAYEEHWRWLDRLDSPALNTLHAYGVAHPGWVTGWNAFCTVLGPSAFRLLGLVAAILAAVRRRWRVVLFLVVSIGLSGPVSEAAKALVDRPRPATLLVTAPSSSFPSGHAVGVMVGVLALMTVLPSSRGGWRRVVGCAVAAAVVVAVGVGRVVLNVHHPSDVLAGWALGYAYFWACAAGLGPRAAVSAPS